MFSTFRRRFLKQISALGAVSASNGLFGGFLSGQTTGADGAAQLYVDSKRTISSLDRNLFGSFLEQLGRAIYEGIYDPGSKLSDQNGFRKDVMEQIRKLGVPIIRYPGEILFRATTGWTGWVPNKIARSSSIRPGTR